MPVSYFSAKIIVLAKLLLPAVIVGGYITPVFWGGDENAL